MRFLSSLTACAVSLISYSTAQQTGPDSTFDPARPPDIPLAVRSPYLSTWQQAGSDGGNGGYLAGQYPSFWTFVHSVTQIELTSAVHALLTSYIEALFSDGWALLKLMARTTPFSELQT